MSFGSVVYADLEIITSTMFISYGDGRMDGIRHAPFLDSVTEEEDRCRWCLESDEKDSKFVPLHVLGSFCNWMRPSQSLGTKSS